MTQCYSSSRRKKLPEILKGLESPLEYLYLRVSIYSFFEETFPPIRRKIFLEDASNADSLYLYDEVVLVLFSILSILYACLSLISVG